MVGTVEKEILDIQVCVSRQFVKYGRNVSFSRCFSAEIHDMEIEKIENVFHIDVLQIHGFYCDTETKTVRFDAVIDFLAPDNKEVYQNVCQKVTALYPDYTFQIQLDSDFSD